MRITAEIASSVDLPPLALYGAPPFEQYQRVASVAAVPMSLPREAYDQVTQVPRTAYHQFTWATDVARKIYELAEPDFLSSRHVLMMAEQLVLAHKNVYGAAVAHEQYNAVQRIFKSTWSKPIAEDYESSLKSYRKHVMGWIQDESCEDLTVCRTSKIMSEDRTLTFSSRRALIIPVKRTSIQAFYPVAWTQMST